MSFREYITMFTSLVTTIGDMELKCKVVHDFFGPNYLEPQEEATLLPQEEVTLLPHEEVTLLPHEEATLLPHEEATLLPQEEATDEPAIPFITP